MTTYTFPTNRDAGRADFTPAERLDTELMLAVERADLEALLAADDVILDQPDAVVETLAEATGATITRRYSGITRSPIARR